MTKNLLTNIAGYKFVQLEPSTFPELRRSFREKCSALALKGTILIAPEGINLSIVGTQKAIDLFRDYLQNNSRFADIQFCVTHVANAPFKRMLVKIKKETITMGAPDICLKQERGNSISPQEFKQWLDEKRDMVVLDARNNYEVELGTFANAVHLNLEDFRQFPQAIQQLDPALKEKPVVTFCTGGIRCEKASLELSKQGFKKVYQLEKGILNYFAQCGGAHYQGTCFVFDDRIAVNEKLEPCPPAQ